MMHGACCMAHGKLQVDRSVACRMLLVVSYMFHVACRMSSVTCHMLYFACRMLYFAMLQGNAVGTAYGTMTSLQNLGLAVFPQIIAAVQQR